MTETSENRSFPRRAWLLIAMAATVIVLPLLLWLGRIPIAEFVARQVCNSRSVSCSLSIDRLSFGQINASDVRVEGEGVDPLTIENIQLTLNWPQFLGVEISSVEVEKPRLTVDATGGRVRVGVLELMQSGDEKSGTGFDVPPFSFRNGEVVILTDAGPVRGRLSSSGSLGREIQSHVLLEPAELKTGNYHLSLRAGEANFVYSNGQISGGAQLVISSAKLRDLALEDLNLNLEVRPTGDMAYVANWRLTYDQLDYQSVTMSDVASEGEVELRAVDGELSAEALEILRLEGAVNARHAEFAHQAADRAELTFALEPSGGALSGPIGGHAKLDFPDMMDSERAVLSGEIRLSRRMLTSPAGTFSGALSLQDTQLSDAILETVLSPLSLPDPVDQHGNRLNESLRSLFQRFDAGTKLSASFDLPNGQTDLDLAGPSVAQSSNSQQKLSIQPVGQESWLTLNGEQLQLTGRLQYRDGARSIALNAQALEVARDTGAQTLSVLLKDLTLSEMPAGERKLSADLDVIDYRATQALKSLHLTGGIRFSGPAFGLELQALQLSGDLTGADPGNGWTLRVPDQSCLKVSFISADLPVADFGPASTDICAASQPLYQSRGRLSSGMASASTLDIPLSTSFATGKLAAEDAVITWGFEDSFTLELSASNFDAPLQIQDGEEKTRAADFSAALMKTGLATSPDGLDLNFDFQDNTFTLADLPVDVSLTELRGEGASTDAGLDMDYSVLGARIADGMNEPENAMYQPLLFSGEGKLTDKSVTAEGRLRLADRQALIGNLSVSHEFEPNAGRATLQNGTLTFTPNGLQLYDITERLRGIAVNASGEISPSAEVNWSGGDLSSTGEVVVNGLSFATFRLGEVRGLSGTLTFEDLIGLKTYPDQRVTVDELRFTPAIRLMDGEILLSIPGPDAFILESASWPFVGGELSVDPMVWRYAGEEQLITVTAKEWELARLLGLFEIPDLQVDGKVSGQFPIEIEGANAYFRNARLTAVEDGYIRYDSEVTRNAGQADPYAKMAFDALKNFEYRVLSLGANGNLTGEIVIDMAISGRNPEVMKGQVFNLNVNLQSDLAKLVHAGSISGSVKAAQDLVVDLVKQKQEDEQND